jgi:hypothetical protein
MSFTIDSKANAWALYSIITYRRKRRNQRDSDEDSDEDEDKVEEEEENDEDEEEEENDVAGSSAVSPGSIENREIRKAEKKKKKQAQVVPEEDQDLVNPNHLPVKNLSLSDVGAPRQLSRRER